jgi:hypothetical protein
VRCRLELEGLPIYHRRGIHRFVGFPPSGLTRAHARALSGPITVQSGPDEAPIRPRSISAPIRARARGRMVAFC